MINVYILLGISLVCIIIIMFSIACGIYWHINDNHDFPLMAVLAGIGFIVLVISLSFARYNQVEYQRMYDFSDKYNIEFQKSNQRDATYMWIDSNGSTCYVDISNIDSSKLVGKRCPNPESQELQRVGD